MDGRIRVLSRNNGPIDARVMLIGEGPGRLGAGRSGVPFGGDESGRRLNRLLDAAGWTRAEVFITNAILCNPLDASGRNRPPRATELHNCRHWLQAQIETINPLLVVALGAVALASLNRIEPHGLRVHHAGESPLAWHFRHLAAAYHPGARAAIHRPVERQVEDFQRLGNWHRTIMRGHAVSTGQGPR
jgi:DNA polymerase